MQWDSVLYHPDWRYTDAPGGRYVVRREKKRSRMWIVTFNGERMPQLFPSRDAAQRWVKEKLHGEV